jgi:hypothetical protein
MHCAFVFLTEPELCMWTNEQAREICAPVDEMKCRCLELSAAWEELQNALFVARMEKRDAMRFPVPPLEVDPVGCMSPRTNLLLFSFSFISASLYPSLRPTFLPFCCSFLLIHTCPFRPCPPLFLYAACTCRNGSNSDYQCGLLQTTPHHFAAPQFA